MRKTERNGTFFSHRILAVDESYMSSINLTSTPNPNSIKFTLKNGTFIESGMESFNSQEEAAGHELGERLFRIPGVLNVFILPQFLTVTKADSTDWDDIVPEIESAVEHTLGT